MSNKSHDAETAMNGAESLVTTLLASGVDTCFANPGTSEMHFVAALDRIAGMRCVLGLFEGVVTGAADVLGALVARLDQGVAVTPWAVVNMGQGARGWFSPLGDMGGGHLLVRAHYFPVTTTALLWNRAGAAAFLRDAGQVTMPVDHWLRVWASEAGTGLALNPPIFPAKGAESEIDAAGSRASKRRGWRYFWAKQLRQMRVKRAAAAAKAAFEGR